MKHLRVCLPPAAALLAVLLQCFHTGSESATVRIACVGNSITQGAWLADPSRQSYPSVLQRLLGEGYVVYNLGHSGTCAQRTADGPYWESERFAELFTLDPDIIVMMLGTNDSKPYNWTQRDTFALHYGALIDTFSTLKSPPRIWVCLPPPAFSDSFDICDTVISGYIVPAIESLAVARSLGVIDCHTPMRGQEEHFPDGIHPDSVGAELLAVLVRRALERVGE